MHIIIYTQIDFRINTGFEAIFCLFEYILYDFKVMKLRILKTIIMAFCEGVSFLSINLLEKIMYTARSILLKVYCGI